MFLRRSTSLRKGPIPVYINMAPGEQLALVCSGHLKAYGTAEEGGSPQTAWGERRQEEG
jgi:hypothetical protein